MKTCYNIPGTRAVADLEPIEGHENSYLLTRINVPVRSRGQGLAKQLLEMILNDADREGATLWLEPVASGGLTYQELVDWYERHGFVPADDHTLDIPHLWVRLPLRERIHRALTAGFDGRGEA